MSGEIDYTAQLKGHLRLDATGQWWHECVAFKNERLAKLFSRSVVWDPKESAYFVQIGRQRAAFDCEDTALFVMELLDGAEPWQVKLSTDAIESLDPTSISIGAEGQFYCMVLGNQRARFSRAAHQRLLMHAIDERTLRIGDQLIKVQNATS